MVIADTNIFYDFDAGSIAKTWFEKYQIVGTILSQFELVTSPNLVDRFPIVKGAARAMNHHCNNIIPLSPPDFLIKRFIPDYRINEQRYLNIKESFKMLLSQNIHLSVDREKAKQIITDYEKPFTDMRVNENKRLLEIRVDEKFKGKFKDEKFRTEIRKTDLTGSKKSDVISFLQQHHSKDYPDQPLIIDEDADEWNDLEFFLNVWTDYDKCFFGKQVRTVKKNDLMDVFITAYVGRNDLYWTNDEFFIDLIKANPITAKYLHPLCGRKRQW